MTNEGFINSPLAGWIGFLADLAGLGALVVPFIFAILDFDMLAVVATIIGLFVGCILCYRKRKTRMRNYGNAIL